MTLLERLQAEMVAAMKAKAEARLGTLRMMKSALKKHEIDAMKPLDEAVEQQLLTTLIKQRRESVEMFRKGGREDLAVNEEAEIKVIEGFMPEMLSEDDVRAAVDAAVAETGASGPKGMGLVMKAVKEKLTGKRVDNKLVSDLVKARLG
ncbi:MAG: GatB/YqeY domain-containing protein [Bryobacteraceae bacterium]|nr:GatB/YqeY domain-containing protein [Bryobacteraceae bacterium]